MFGTRSSDMSGPESHTLEERGFRPEKILKHRPNKIGEDEYLVHWVKFEREVEDNFRFCTFDDVWESADTVKKYPELSNDFRRINLGKRELVAREEGRKKRMEGEGGSGGQGQSLDMTAPTPEAAGSSKKTKSKTSCEEPGSSSPSMPPTSASSMEQCLESPVILANIFKVCPHDLLAYCRLVCKTWYQESLVTWRFTSSLIVLHRLNKKDEIYLAKTKDLNRRRVRYRDSTPEDEDNDFDASSKTSLPTFLAYLGQECATKQYRQFHLSNWSFTSPSTSRNSSRGTESIQGQQDRFWELVGGNVTFLKLSKCTLQNASAFRKIIFQTCPNLQTLILDTKYKSYQPVLTTQYQVPAYGEHKNLKSLSVSRGVNQVLPISFMEILSHFPSLTSLNLVYDKLLGYNDADMGDLISWINAIKVIRQHDKNTLAFLKVNMSPGFQLGHSVDPAKCRELCTLFHGMNLHPQLLDVNLHCDVVGVLKDVLTFPFRKIRALEDGGSGGCCGLGSRPTPPSKEFPCKFPFGVELDNLVELSLSAGFCRDMEFMKWTPNLEKLEILQNDRERGHHGGTPNQMVLNTSEAIMADVKLLKLKELWMGFKLSDVEEARRFCGWMPNLEVATLFLDDEQFGVICENWSKLKHLHVLGSLLGDKGITGMGFEGDDDGDGLGVAAVRPNITRLKELNCFQFSILDSKLSDASIYNGFIKLPKLQTLEIASYKSTIGDEAMTAIHEKVPNCQIIGSPEMYGPIYIGGGPRIRQRDFRCRYFP